MDDERIPLPVRLAFVGSLLLACEETPTISPRSVPTPQEEVRAAFGAVVAANSNVPLYNLVVPADPFTKYVPVEIRDAAPLLPPGITLWETHFTASALRWIGRVQLVSQSLPDLATCQTAAWTATRKIIDARWCNEVWIQIFDDNRDIAFYHRAWAAPGRVGLPAPSAASWLSPYTEYGIACESYSPTLFHWDEAPHPSRAPSPTSDPVPDEEGNFF